jgi:hypothetical protein
LKGSPRRACHPGTTDEDRGRGGADDAQVRLALHEDANTVSFLLHALFLFARVSKDQFVPEMPPKAAVTEAAPNVYRDSLLGVSLQMAAREIIANQGLMIRFPPCVRIFV